MQLQKLTYNNYTNLKGLKTIIKFPYTKIFCDGCCERIKTGKKVLKLKIIYKFAGTDIYLCKKCSKRYFKFMKGQ